MKSLNSLFAKRTMELLIKNDVSKYRLEKDTGLNHTTIINIFKDEQKDVRFSTVAKVAKYFNISLAEFLKPEYFNLEKIDLE